MVCALLLVGCSVTVIRPPSAGAFMEKSEDKFVKDVSFSLNLSDCWLDSIGCNQESEKNVKKEEKEDWSYKREEYPFAFFNAFINSSLVHPKLSLSSFNIESANFFNTESSFFSLDDNGLFDGVVDEVQVG